MLRTIQRYQSTHTAAGYMCMSSFRPGSKVSIYVRLEGGSNKCHVLPAFTRSMLFMVVEVVLPHAVLTIVNAHNYAACKQAVERFIYFPFFIKGSGLVK